MTGQELFESRERICTWDRLPDEAKANWERIAEQRQARIAALRVEIAENKKGR